MFLKNRAIVFIDGSNLYHDLINNFGKANLGFLAFANFLSRNNKLVKVYYYSAPINQRDNPEGYRRQQQFFSSLSKIQRFEVKLGRLEKRSSGPPVEKGVDVTLAVDMVALAYSNVFDIAILVSGDADFVPAIRAVQDFGKKVTNVCFPKTKCFHLNQICNETILIGQQAIEKLYWQKSSQPVNSQ